MMGTFSKSLIVAGLGLLTAGFAMAEPTQTASNPEPDGNTLYHRYCAGCHDPGPGHPATMLLTDLHREHPPLIGRKDLQPDYVRSVARNGLIEMPPFRPTELTDAELARVIDYIETAGGNKAPTTGK